MKLLPQRILRFHRVQPVVAILSAYVALAAGGFVRLSAADAPADAPAAPAPAAPAAAPTGVTFVFAPPKEGEVLIPSAREKLLAIAKNFLERDNPELQARLQAATNPYYVKLPPPPEPPKPVDTPGQPAPPPQLSDLEKLQQVADQLKPTGALVANQQRILILGSGQTVTVGQVFNMTFPGETTQTEITLLDATSDTYTLKLRNTSHDFPFAAKPAASAAPKATAPARPSSSAPPPNPVP